MAGTTGLTAGLCCWEAGVSAAARSLAPAMSGPRMWRNALVSMGDMFATTYKALGIDWRKEYVYPIGRPVKIANAIDDKTGAPIKELI
jgi:hypothetical protein